MPDWAEFQNGMEAARSSGDPGAQLTTDEAKDAGGPDFMAGQDTDQPADWQRGYDYAIRLARAATRRG